jgi:ADP-ribose pyrophosphatase
MPDGDEAASYPRIVGARRTRLSPWATLVEKDVVFTEGEPLQTYHCLTQADYVGVLAITPDGLVPLVRQFRPAVECYTWELPAGTIDAGETAADAARRELLEEAGLHADTLVPLGAYHPDTGRLDIKSHVFFARASRAEPAPAIEAGLETRFVSCAQLRQMIREREFTHQLHLGVYAAVLVAGVCPELLGSTGS